MARIKGAMMTRKRRNKVLKAAKGYWGSKSKHFKMPVDHPYLRRLQDQRNELLQLHERAEEGGRYPEPQDAFRDRHRRSRRFHRSVRAGEGCSVIHPHDKTR